MRKILTIALGMLALVAVPVAADGITVLGDDPEEISWEFYPGDRLNGRLGPHVIHIPGGLGLDRLDDYALCAEFYKGFGRLDGGRVILVVDVYESLEEFDAGILLLSRTSLDRVEDGRGEVCFTGLEHLRTGGVAVVTIQLKGLRPARVSRDGVARFTFDIVPTLSLID